MVPAAVTAAAADAPVRRWLGRANLDVDDPNADLFSRTIRLLGREPPLAGLAARRYYGQTGELPTGWICAADPVYLEPRLDHIRVHDLSQDAVPEDDLRRLFAELEQRLSGEAGLGFSVAGDRGYLHRGRGITGATVPASVVDGREPSPFLPQGADGKAYHRLASELEMALHESRLRVEREAAGVRPVNGLWIWGGGEVPESVDAALPPLFGDDALFRGHWLLAKATVRSWQGSLADCIEAAGSGFVAVAAAADARAVLAEAHRLSRLRLPRIQLVFADGINLTARRIHRLRVWRRARLPGAAGDGSRRP